MKAEAVEITTGSTNQTVWLENGVEVWPCGCGETHRGDYGHYDFVHHNCPHDDELFLNTPFVNQEQHLVAQAICILCGQAWRAWGDERLQFGEELGR